MRFYEIDYHLYADDTQLHLAFHPLDGVEKHGRLEACIAEVRAQMAAKFLCLNNNKTEFSDSPLADILTVLVRDSEVPVVFQARSLGVILTSARDMKAQISSICKSV